MRRGILALLGLLPAWVGQSGGAQAVELSAALAGAPRLKVEGLGEGYGTTRTGPQKWALNPDGKSWDLLQFYFKAYGGPNHAVAIDFSSGQVTHFDLGTGLHLHNNPSVMAPDGRLYMTCLKNGYDIWMIAYDPASNTIDPAPFAIPSSMHGESRPLCVGTDGCLYIGGAHPTEAANILQVNVKTKTLKELGPIGPSHAPSQCLGYSVAADDRYCYIASGKIPWHLVSYDRETGASKVLLTREGPESHIDVSQRSDGCFGYFQTAAGVENRHYFWLHENEVHPSTAAISSEPSAGETPPWQHRQDLRQPAREPSRPALETGTLIPDGSGEVRVRYQKSREQRDAETQTLRYRVPIHPQTIRRVWTLPDGRVMGSSGGSGSDTGFFVYEPASGAIKGLGQRSFSHYATAIAGNKVYLSGYPLGELHEFDAGAEWAADNPRRVATLDKWAGIHKAYAGAAAGDGRVYFGGRWLRNGNGGGLGWWDAVAGKGGGTWKEFSAQQIHHLAVLDGGRKLVVSTVKVRDAVLHKPTPPEGALLVFDTVAQKLSGTLAPEKNVPGPGPLVALGGGMILGWSPSGDDAKGSVLYTADMNALAVTQRRKLPLPLPVGVGSNQTELWDMQRAADGSVLSFLEGCLIRIDPADLSIRVIGKVQRAGRMALAGPSVYLSGETYLRRLHLDQ